MLRQYNKYISVLFFSLAVFLCGSCTSPASEITAVVETLCRSRMEGDYDAYLKCVGGDILLRELTGSAGKAQFTRTALAHKNRGMLFVDIYVREIRVNTSARQASVFFIEKWSQGTRTFTASRRWQLEFIDGSWRIVRF